MLEVLDFLLLGLRHIVLEPENLMWVTIGCGLGMVTGVLPGFGPAAATALLLPLAFVIGPTGSVVMIAAIYYGSMYGGTITSVLLNVPGEVSSVATCIDGYAMTKRGQAGKALAIAAVGSFVGGIISIAGLLFTSQYAAQFALSMTFQDLFALSIFALTLVIALTGKSMSKGLVSAFAGLFVGVIGIDTVTGRPRFTMGQLELLDGVEFVAVVMGLFGLAEILESIGQRTKVDFSGNIGSLWLKWQDIKDTWGSMLRGTVIGFFFGLVPGSPAAANSFTSYVVEKRVSKHPETFGNGAIQGVAGPETANNALGISNFIPLLTLGIPSSATMAILLGAFTINGLTPGPLLFAERPEVAWGIIASMLVANVVLLVMSLPLVGMWVSILRMPTMVLYALTLGFVSLGSYTISNSTFDVVVLWISGLVGFTFRRLDVPLAPAALTLVLGPLLEDNFRRALSLQRGTLSGFFVSGVSRVTYAIILIVFITKGVTTFQKWRHRRHRAAATAAIARDGGSPAGGDAEESARTRGA